MMTGYTKSLHAKFVGRYAIFWAHLTERRISRSNRFYQKSSNQPDVAMALLNKKIQKPVSEGKKEVNKLEKAVKESEGVIASATSVFPFTFFPTTISVDLHKLTIKNKMFFQAGQTISVPLKDIKNVQATVGPLFASLVITSDNFVNNTQEVNYLWRKDAEKIQKIIQGVIVAKNEDIDISKIPADDLEQHLPKLGEGLE